MKREEWTLPGRHAAPRQPSGFLRLRRAPAEVRSRFRPLLRPLRVLSGGSLLPEGSGRRALPTPEKEEVRAFPAAAVVRALRGREAD